MAVKKRSAKRATSGRPARSKKRAAGHAQRRQRAPKVQLQPSASDVEAILVDRILGSDMVPENGTAVENLIYNATPKVAEIGYSYGFSVGRELCLKQKDGQKFTNILDRIGLSNALYYPLKDSLIITSRPSQGRLPNLRHPIHVYEAGVIAGYLSLSTGIKITTAEKRCIYNGAESCQFVSLPAQSSPQQYQEGMALDSVISTIARSMTEGDFKKLHKEYYRIIAYFPLLRQPMYEQVRKLMVMSGERMAEYAGKDDARRIIKNITNYFGVRDAEVSLRRQGKSIIKLRFESYNSIYPYVSMPTAMIVGFVSTAFGKSAEVSTSTNKDKTYTTTIGFKDNSA